MNTKIIELNNVAVAYRGNVALKGITLDIEEGTFISVIGPNGAGKSTLLTVINGLGTILEGSVKIFGRPLEKSDLSAVRREIGYVPQHLNIDRRMPISVQEAVSIGRFAKAGFLKTLSDKDNEIIVSAMESVSIAHFADKPIGHLSGGEHQKVSIARALAQQPKIILLDEPTSNLDPKAQIEILSIIEKIYSEKKYTVVFVTHTLNHIPDYCTRAVLIKKGRVMYAGESVSAFDETLLSELYDCPIEIGTIKGRRHFHAGLSHP